MVTTSLSERCGAGPGRFKACWITADPFIVSSTMVKMVVRTVALSSICSALLVCLSCLQTEVYYRSHSLSATSTKRKCLLAHTLLSIPDIHIEFDGSDQIERGLLDTAVHQPIA